MARISYIEYGETVSKNYQSKRLAIGAEVGPKDNRDEVLEMLRSTVQDYLSERKQKANALRQLADAVERGEANIDS